MLRVHGFNAYTSMDNFDKTILENDSSTPDELEKVMQLKDKLAPIIQGSKLLNEIVSKYEEDLIKKKLKKGGLGNTRNRKQGNNPKSTEEEVWAKMRESRQSNPTGSFISPKFVHTCESAELELKRQGFDDIRKTWLSVYREEVDSSEEVPEGIEVYITKIRDLGEKYTLPEGKTFFGERVWCSLKYFNGMTYEMFFVRPEEEKFEKWLPDEYFDSVVYLSFAASSMQYPIRSLCNKLKITEPKNAKDIFVPSYSHTVSYLENFNDSNMLLYTHTSSLINLLGELGLFDFDYLYGNDCFLRYRSLKGGSPSDDPPGLFQDTFSESKGAIKFDDPRSVWLELGELDDFHVDLFRRQVVELAVAAYDTGYETARTEIVNKYGKGLVRDGKMKDGRPKQGMQLTEHTTVFKEAAEVFLRKRGERPTGAKLRKFINDSQNEKWISVLRKSKRLSITNFCSKAYPLNKNET